MVGTRPQPRRRYHHGDLPSALIAATRRMLEKAGPESISFRAIARQAGVSQTAPYNHFSSKEHLLATLAAAGFRELETSQMVAIETPGTIVQKIEALGRAYVRFARRQPQLYRLMFGVGMSHWRARPEVETAKKASFEPLKTVVTTYLTKIGRNSDRAAEIAAVTGWAIAHGLSMLLIDGVLDVPDDDAETLTTQVTAWLAAGFESGARTVNKGRPAKRHKGDKPIHARERRSQKRRT